MTENEINAKRYLWLRSQHWEDNIIGVVLHPQDAVQLGRDLPSGKRLDDFIDARMAAEPVLAEAAGSEETGVIQCISMDDTPNNSDLQKAVQDAIAEFVKPGEVLGSVMKFGDAWRALVAQSPTGPLLLMSFKVRRRGGENEPVE